MLYIALNMFIVSEIKAPLPENYLIDECTGKQEKLLQRERNSISRIQEASFFGRVEKDTARRLSVS